MFLTSRADVIQFARTNRLIFLQAKIAENKHEVSRG